MRVGIKNRALVIVAAGCLLACSAGSPAFARPLSSMIVAPAPWTPGRFFIEFRARRSSYIGHTYIVYGRQDAAGRVIERHVVGLIPEVDAWKGLIAPIRATVREYKDDARFTPTAIYRRRLTPVEYIQVSRRVAYLHAHEHRWHAIFQNCNDFGIKIADALGLSRPPSLMPPSAWVGTLRLLNER